MVKGSDSRSMMVIFNGLSGVPIQAIPCEQHLFEEFFAGTPQIMVMFVGLPSGKLSHNYGKSPFLLGKSTISMVIFNSYVKLPEGITFYNPNYRDISCSIPKPQRFTCSGSPRSDMVGTFYRSPYQW